jgi:hypothetical protein
MRIFSTFLGALQNEMHVKVDALNHQMHKLGPIAMGYFPMRICGLAASPSRHYDRSRALTINVSSPPTPHVLPARRTRFYYLRQHRTAIAVLRTYLKNFMKYFGVFVHELAFFLTRQVVLIHDLICRMIEAL